MSDIDPPTRTSATYEYQSVTLRKEDIADLKVIGEELGVDQKAPAVIRALIRKYKNDKQEASKK